MLIAPHNSFSVKIDNYLKKNKHSLYKHKLIHDNSLSCITRQAFVKC